MTMPPMITSQADLESLWRTLMSPLGFSRASIWFLFLDDDGTATPHLTQVEDGRRPPTRRDLDHLAQLLCELMEEEAASMSRVAILRSRPGRGPATDADRAWAAATYDACRSHDVRCEVLHLATDDDVWPVPLDALPVPA